MIKLVEILFEIREFDSVGDKGIREIRDTRTQGHGNHGSRQWMVRRDNGRSQTQSPPAMTPPTLSAFCLLPSAFPALPRINFDLILGIKCTTMHNHSCCGRQLFPRKIGQRHRQLGRQQPAANPDTETAVAWAVLILGRPA